MARKEQCRPPAPFPGPRSRRTPRHLIAHCAGRKTGAPGVRDALSRRHARRVCPLSCCLREHLGLDAHLGRVLRFGLNENSS